MSRVNGRFQVKLPLKSDITELLLGDSFGVAFKRLQNLEKRFAVNPILFKEYATFMNEYVSLGYAKVFELANYNLRSNSVYFLAHHPVIREDKKSTKLRVVFDGSMKTKSKISLNDVMFNGAIVQPELFDVLILFRTYQFIFITDIKQMYRQVLIHPDHRQLLNMLWRENPNLPIQCLQLQTVTYGLKASPHLATRCLVELAHQEVHKFPLASKALLNNCYIDDFLCGSNDLAHAVQLKTELIKVLSSAHFELHKWCANHPDLLVNIPKDKQHFEEINLSNDNMVIKTLGLSFEMSSDTFKIACPETKVEQYYTKRVLGFVLRFINNIRDTKNKLTGNLSTFELQNSLNCILKHMQNIQFATELTQLKSNKEVTSNLKSLFPFIDKNGLLRVGGRLQNAPIPFSKMHPIILSQKCHITTLIITNEHLAMLHAGPKQVLANLRQRYWLINSNREIKRVLHKCVTCFRMKAKGSEQLMGSLPVDRVSIARVYQKVGVDFGGPFYIKQSRIRNCVITKAYIALFVCFVTKAVHIELVSDLTTETFLGAFQRFIGRRGRPTIVYSDNGSTFRGANNQLKELFKLFSCKEHKTKVENTASSLGIQWFFIPSYSPVFGGLWEAGIKSAKHHIKRVVGKLNFTYEELDTVLIQIEGILNSRPLCQITNDPSDLTYLTPGHFIIGTTFTSFPESDVCTVPINRLTFWKQCTQAQQSFWKAWAKDYLVQLQNRPKWQRVSRNVEEGMLVIIRNDNLPPLEWNLGRIIKVVLGPDKKIRVIELKTKNGTCRTSISKIAVLPIYAEG